MAGGRNDFQALGQPEEMGASKLELDAGIRPMVFCATALVLVIMSAKMEPQQAFSLVCVHFQRESITCCVVLLYSAIHKIKLKYSLPSRET